MVIGPDQAIGILKGLHESLADDGVMVASMGYAPARYSPAADAEIAKGFSRVLVEAGFESVRDYEEVRITGVDMNSRKSKCTNQNHLSSFPPGASLL